MSINSEDKNFEEIDLNVFKYFTKLKSIKFLFISVIMIFLFLLIIAIFYANFVIMSSLYNSINNNYLNQYIIQPISNVNENFTQTLSIRIKTLEEIVTESQMLNVKTMTNFIFSNDVEVELDYVINNNEDMLIVLENSLTNFYINISEDTSKQTVEQQQAFLKKYKNLSYFLKFFQMNYFFPFVWEEMTVMDTKNYRMNYLTYTNNFNQNQNILLDCFQENYKVAETNQNFLKYDFVNYIIENIYSSEEYPYNFVKLQELVTQINNVDYFFIFFFRLNNNQMCQMMNTMGNNMTIIFQNDDFYSENITLNFLPISNYLKQFFKYGMQTNIIPSYYDPADGPLLETLKIKLRDDLYYQTDLEIFFKLLNDQTWIGSFNSSHIVINESMYDEYRVMGGLFYKILLEYYKTDIYKDFLGSNLNYTKCLQSIGKLNSNLTCDIINFFEEKNLYTLQFYENSANTSTISSSNINITQVIEYLNYTMQEKYGDAKYYIDSGIFKSSQNLDFQKKFLIYKTKMTNLEVVKIDMVSYEDYYQIQSNFITKIGVYSRIIVGMLILFCFLVFMVSFIITYRSVNSLLERINLIRNIKMNIFFKDEAIPIVLAGKHGGCQDAEQSMVNYKNVKNRAKSSSKLEILQDLAKKIGNKEISQKEKFDFLDKDLFEQQLLIIICESKQKLMKLLRKVDNETDPAFLNRLDSFQRRYRLCKFYINVYYKFYLLVRNYGIAQDEDFKSSSLIYKEIKNINFFKLEDVSYNLYYNHTFVNNFFCVLYRILDTVDDGAVIIDKNLKYLKFEEIIKFVFHIKRRLINPFVAEVFGIRGEFLNKNKSNNLKYLMKLKSEKNVKYFGY